MNRFTVTISYTYDVDDETLAKNYETSNLVEAAAIDEYNYKNYSYLSAEEISHGVDNYTATVTAEKLDEL